MDAEQPGYGSPGTGGAPPISESLPAGPNLMDLHRKARAGLALELPPDEAVRVVIPGLASSALVATNARAFVFKMGAKAGLPFATRLKEFEFESVLRVDLKPSGSVQVVVIHAQVKIGTCSSYWADARDDVWKARNAIPVEPGDAAASSVERLDRLVRDHQDRNVAKRQTPNVLDRMNRADRSGPAQIIPVPSPVANGAGGPVRQDCPRCGAELSAGWQFCPRCGTPSSGPPERAAERRRRRH